MQRIFLSGNFFLMLAVGLLACTQSSQSQLNYVKKDPPQPGAAAKIFGEVVTVNDLESNNIKIFQKKLEVYNAQKREVDERVRRKVFEKLAADADMSVDEFMAKEMEKSKKRVSDREVMDFLKGRIEDPKNAPDHIKDQVKGIIHLQNIVANYTKKNPVELYLKRPRAEEIDFDLEGSPVWGREDAPVTLIEYSDFQCPFCAKADTQVVKELKKRYGKRKLKVVFKHFPLSIHKDAKPAAMASLCVHEQNERKFWDYHDILFKNQRNLGADDLKAYAKKVGVNVSKFEECMQSNKYAQKVQADFDEGMKIGVNSTPSFFINSQPILGARNLEQFAELIDEELERANKKN